MPQDGGEAGIGNNSLDKVLGTIERLSSTAGAVVALIGAVLALAVPQKPVFYVVCGAIVLLGVGWFLFGRILRNRARPPPAVRPSPGDGLTLIRGPLPLNSTDVLLGRDRDLDLVTLMASQQDVRMSLLSGEAGAGKTSLLRAGFLRAVAALEPPLLPIYVARSGARPDDAVRDAIAAAANGAGPPGSLGDAAEALAASKGRQLLIILDQFEEFFIVNRTVEARASSVAALRQLCDPRGRNSAVRLLFSIRKEFVDDLLTIFAELQTPVDRRNRYALLNFSVPVAHGVLDEIASKESLPFSIALRRRVVSDLVRDERVRPVEFQLVLSRMLEQQIEDFPAYERAGGAWGIISRYIADAIDAPSAGSPEYERQLARHLLRALCSETFDARRPQGLTLAELQARIEAPLRSMRVAAGISDHRGKALIETVVDRLRAAYVLIDESGGRINLAHDYLAPAVRDATADVETMEERSNRILEQYAARQKSGERFVFLRPRMLRQVERYASAELRGRTDMRAIVRRSRGLRAARTLGVAALVVGLPAWLTLTQQSGWVVRPVRSLPIDARASLSGNGELLLLQDSDDRLTIIDLNDSGFPAHAVAGQFEAVMPSPTASELLGLRPNGRLVALRQDNGFAPEELLDLGWRNVRNSSSWANFSSDGAWRTATSIRGEVFTWLPGHRPQVIGRFSHFTDQHGNPLRPGESRRPYTGGDEGVIPPRQLRLSRRGRFVAVADGTTLQIWRAGTSRPPLVNIEEGFSSFSALAFSPNESSVVWAGSSGLSWKNLASNDPPRVLLRPDYRSPESVSPTFSPSGRWLVMRVAFGPFHSWKVGSAVISEPIAPPPPRSGGSRSDAPSAIVFDRSERIVAGRGPDLHAYLWNVADPDPQPLPFRRERVDNERNRMQTILPCQGGERAVLRLSSGRVVRVDTSNPVEIEPVVGPSPIVLADQTVLQRMTGSDLVLAFAGRRLAMGRCTAGSWTEWYLSGSVIEVRAGRRGAILNVLTDRELIQFEERFEIWGIGVPGLRRTWPQPDEEART